MGLDDCRARGWRGPLTRREFLTAAARLGAVAAVGGLAACTGPRREEVAAPKTPRPGGAVAGPVPGPQPVSGGRYGGRVVVAWAEEPNSFDPILGYNLSAWDGITEVVFFGGLLAYGGQSGGPVPNLAEDLPEVSVDGTTLTFRLRPDVRFHNGRTITAEDVKFSLERLLDPALASWATSYVASIVGARDVVKGRTKTLEGVEVVDSRTLKIHLTQPDFTILNSLSLPMTAPVPREEVERLGEDFGRTPVGFGPFKVESFDPTAQRAVFVKNENYLWKGLPYVDEVEFRWGVESQAAVLQLQHGEVDILGDGVPSTAMAEFVADPQNKELVQFVPVLAERFLVPNHRRPPFDRREVRQALNWAVDRDALARISFGEANPLGTPFPNMEGFPRTFSGYDHDPGTAKELLTEAGLPGGFSTTLTYEREDPWPSIAQVLQQQLAEVGVALDLEQVGGNALQDLAAQGALPLHAFHWFLIQPTPADLVDALFVTGASNNWSGYSNPEVDRLASQAKAEFDEAKRNELYARIEQLIGEDAAHIWLESFNFIAGRSRRIQNYHYRGELGTYYDRLWLAS